MAHDISDKVNRRWVLARAPGGSLDPSGFQFTEAPVPLRPKGQVMVRNLWLSMDPTQILFTHEDSGLNIIPIGGVMHCISSGQVVDSLHPEFSGGDMVQGWFGWEDYTVIDVDAQTASGLFPMAKLSTDIAPDLAIGTLGVTGMAAYLGMEDVANPKPGETSVVTSATGGAALWPGR